MKTFLGKGHLASLGMVFALVSLARADEGNRGLSVDFTQCTEAVGVGPVSLAKASALVPPVFTTLPIATANAPTTAAIVVRATSCGGVRVDSGASLPTNISQVGVEVVSPDGTGDINNYTLVYLSNNPELVKRFNHAGVPALLDPGLTYQFTFDPTGAAGEIYVEAEGFGVPAYFITGTEADPTGPAFDFKANWWYAADKGLVKQASDFPNIAFGTANISFHTDRTSVLGQLIGGNTDTDFHYLPVRGKYATAHMVVTVTGK
jgi:hypothetical protein